MAKRDESMQEAYDAGRAGFRAGKSIDENPYPLSGHERDTTFDDERNRQWYSGWNDEESGEPDDGEG